MKTHAAILLGVLSGAAHAEGLLPCQLTTDKWLIYNPYTACVSGYAEISGRGKWDEEQTGHAVGGLAQIYGSVGLGHYLSLHGRAGYSYLTDQDKEVHGYHRAEQLFVQLGHPVADPFYASAGRIDAPFGLNHDAFRLGLPARSNWLWLSSVNGGRIGIGPREGFRIEIGTSNMDQSDPITGEKRTILSGRIVRTIDLLDGVRLIASYASSSDYGERRTGFATLVHNESGRSSLEWVRLKEQTMPDNFQQVFRFVHEQQQKTWSWILAMEDLRRDSYRLSFGVNRPWIYNFIGTFSVHFQREAEEPREHVIVMAGLGIGKAWVWEEMDP